MGGIRVEGSLPPTLFVEERERWGWGGADVIDRTCAQGTGWEYQRGVSGQGLASLRDWRRERLKGGVEGVFLSDARPGAAERRESEGWRVRLGVWRRDYWEDMGEIGGRVVELCCWWNWRCMERMGRTRGTLWAGPAG